jgi:hypothetical protein
LEIINEVGLIIGMDTTWMIGKRESFYHNGGIPDNVRHIPDIREVVAALSVWLKIRENAVESNTRPVDGSQLRFRNSRYSFDSNSLVLSPSDAIHLPLDVSPIFGGRILPEFRNGLC